jgi:hypothetical protein
MNDKKFVKSIMPLARCKPLHQTSFGVGPDYDLTEPMFVVYDIDSQNRPYIVGFSLQNENDAWFKVAETFRKKMLAQLENV